MTLAVLIAIPSLRRPTPVPFISTERLDPAVKALIEKTLDATRTSPRSGAAWGKLGSVLMHYEFVEEAGTAFDYAERLEPGEPRWPYLHALLIQTIDAYVAERKLRRAVELAGDNPDMPRLQLAQFALERGQTSEGLVHFNALLKLNSNHPVALLGLARIRFMAGDADQSLNLLRGCLEDSHTAKAAHALLARVKHALGNPLEAEAAAHRSMTLPDDQPWPDLFWNEALVYRVGKKALLQDASALLDQGRFGEAVTGLERVTRLYADDDEPWYLMGWALNRAQRPAEAEQALRKHLSLAPQSPKGLSQLGVALLEQKRYPEAIEVMQKAVALKPTWRELHFNLGYAASQLGLDGDAVVHLRNALAQDPNHVPTYTALAELLSRQGKRSEAGLLVRQALAIDPLDRRAQALQLELEVNP